MAVQFIVGLGSKQPGHAVGAVRAPAGTDPLHSPGYGVPYLPFDDSEATLRYLGNDAVPVVKQVAFEFLDPFSSCVLGCLGGPVQDPPLRMSLTGY